MKKKLSLNRINNRASGGSPLQKSNMTHQATGAAIRALDEEIIAYKASVRNQLERIKNRHSATGIIDKNELETYWITNKRNQLCRLKLWKYQHWLVDRINQDILNNVPVRDLDNKPRKCGQTTLLVAIGYQLTKRGLSGCIIGDKNDVSTANAYRMIKLMYDKDPDFKNVDRHGLQWLAGKYLEFPGGGNITFASNGSSNAQEGLTKQWIIATEYAKWEGDLEEQAKSLFNTVDNTIAYTFVFIDTTPRPNTDFQDRWYEAVEAWPRIKRQRDRGRPAYGWRPNFIPWTAFEEYQMPFLFPEDRIAFMNGLSKEEIELVAYAKTVKMEMYPEGIDISPEQLQWRRSIMANAKGTELAKIAAFNTEFPLTAEMGFSHSDGMIFDNAKLMAWTQNASAPIYECEVLCDVAKKKFPRESDGNAWDEMLRVSFPVIAHGSFQVWEWPKFGRQYCAGADVAKGVRRENYKTDHSTLHIMDQETGKTVATWYGKIREFAFADLCTYLCTFYNYAYIAVDNIGIGSSVINKMLTQYPRFALYRQGMGDEYDTESNDYGFNGQTNEKKVGMLLLQTAIENSRVHCDDIAVLREAMNLQFEKDGKTIETHGRDRVMAWMICNMARWRDKNYAVITQQKEKSWSENMWDYDQRMKAYSDKVDFELGGRKIPGHERIFK